MPELIITSVATGPLLQGRAQPVINDMLDEGTRVIATKAYSTVHQFLDASIRRPTPYYETQVTLDRQADDYVIHDRGIVYGPWLEGTGSRNRTTRFKGYASFRRARQQVEAEAPAIMEAVIDRLLPQLGGV